jgi:hypothetical protein
LLFFCPSSITSTRSEPTFVSLLPSNLWCHTVFGMAYASTPGWQYEFVKKSPKNLAQPVFLTKLMHELNRGKKKHKNVRYLCN